MNCFLLIIFSIQYSYNKHLKMFDIPVAFNFLFLCFVTGILIFNCYRKDKGMVESVLLTFYIFMLIETLRVNQVIRALGLPVLMHEVSAHFSPHKEIFALYSFFFCDSKMMCLICVIYCTAVPTMKSN